MTDPEGLPGPTEEWLRRLGQGKDRIHDAVWSFEEGLQTAIAPAIIAEVIRDLRGLSTSAPTAQGAQKSFVSFPVTGPARFTKFLEDFQITGEILSKVVDFDSEQILVRSPSSTKAESTRRIAGLLCLINAKKTGEFAVDRERLVKVCEDHGAYDRSNFASHLTEFHYNGSSVFIREGERYRISVPGEAYVAAVVKSPRGSLDSPAVMTAPGAAA